MNDNQEFWDFYWEVRLRALEDLGKSEAVRAVSQLIRGLAEQSPVRLLELGCGEGQIIGALTGAHAGVPGIDASVGVDYLRQAVERCRRSYPHLHFVEGDFTDPHLLESLGQFEVVLLVNALHEVFSAGYAQELGEVDVPAAKRSVGAALAGAAGRVVPGGFLALFDGLEPPGDPHEKLRLRFIHRQAYQHFLTFAREYRPFRISYQPTREPDAIEISRRDFTRYITKSIFLGKRLWETERLESYQYFTEAEFRQAFASLGLEIRALRKLTVDYEKWRSQVEILTPGADFPEEHILILAQSPAQ